MFNKKDFYKEMINDALPITFQSLFQSSVSVIDQVMVGQLGSISITGAGLGGKFSSLFTVTVSAVAAGAGILISQYYGSRNSKGVNNSFISNLYLSLIIGIFFTIISIALPVKIMSLYSADPMAVNEASSYLRIVAIGFIPLTLTLMISTLLRCIGQAKYPMWASIISVIFNTVLNYILIFGKLFFPPMGLRGAAYATDIARITEFILVFVLLLSSIKKKELHVSFHADLKFEFIKKVFIVLYPILICEFLWSLGENGYAVIYGRIGTDACAAMTLTNPVQSLMIGLFSGIAAAAGIITGKALGDDRYDDAYIMAKKMVKVGIWGSILLAAVFSSCASLYVEIFSVDNNIKQDTVYIIYAFSIVLFVKVSNMILGGGVLRSGGRTIIIMFIDMIGTWMFGIPLGIVAAFVFNLPIYTVYFILSLEEVVRFVISLAVFKKKIWMKNLT